MYLFKRNVRYHPQEARTLFKTNSSPGLVSTWRNHRPGPAQRPCGCGTTDSTGPCTSHQLQALVLIVQHTASELRLSSLNTSLVLAAVFDLRPPVYGWHGPHGSGQANDHRGSYLDPLLLSSTILSQVFSTAIPALVTSSFATAYLMSMAGGNLGGRVGN